MNYFVQTQFPVTLVGEWDKSESLKFIITIAYGHEYLSEKEYDAVNLLIEYRPLEVAGSYRYFFYGEAEDGFGIYWALGATIKLNTGKYEVQRMSGVYYGSTPPPLPEFPKENKVPVRYVHIRLGYKFDFDPVHVNLGLFGEFPIIFPVKQSTIPYRELTFTKPFLTITYKLP